MTSQTLWGDSVAVTWPLVATYPGGHADALDGARPASETHL